jgi:hypothetical protein
MANDSHLFKNNQADEPTNIVNRQRIFTLTSQDIALINPNTLTCPSFRTCQDADLIRKVNRRIPILENGSTAENTCDISFMSMFHMANDSHLFKNNQAERLLPLYEAKMFHIYSHRFASAEAPKTEKGFGGSSGKLIEEDLLNSN